MNSSDSELIDRTKHVLQETRSYLEHLRNTSLDYERENAKTRKWLQEEIILCKQLINRCPDIRFPS